MATQYADPFGAMRKLRSYLDSPLGTQGQQAIATAGQAATQQFNRRTGSRAGDLAASAFGQQTRMQTGSEMARQRYQDFQDRLALRSSFLDPQYQGPAAATPSVVGADGIPTDDAAARALYERLRQRFAAS
ncbi:MAG TPA: hypothetical protein PKM73_14550 [Verrucomicrobiota bacterium]|nr:hypothetical protein [Verrucomicrobiota bacterium]